MTASSAAAPFLYSGTELDALADARNYYRAILWHLAPHMGRRIVEVGAGIGTFSAHILEAANPASLTLIEPAQNNIDILRNRFASDTRVRTVYGYIGDVAGRVTADAVVAVNVLEHVDDDVGFLRSARGILGSEGHLLLFVPAGQWLYGALDAAVEHYRRYSKSLLADRLRLAGFDNFRLRYFNFPGIVPWFITGRILKRTTVRAQHARHYDRCIMPWLAPIERWCEPPTGQSILVIARTGKGGAVPA